MEEDQGKLPSQPASPDGRLFVDISDPSMRVDAPVIGRPNRRQNVVDLAEVERLAGIGMKPAAIGPAMGITVSKFRGMYEKQARVRDAYERGNAVWQKALLTKVQEGIAAGGNPALLIFALKQMHGAGWSDNVKVTQDNPVNTDANKKYVEWKKKKDKEAIPPEKLIPMAKGEDGEYSSAE